MSRRDAAWLTDVLSAIQAISGYPAEGSLDEGIVYDARRARLIEIGEAVEHLDPEPAIGKTKPDHSWRGWSP